jgi:hypothetical protein
MATGDDALGILTDLGLDVERLLSNVFEGKRVTRRITILTILPF